MSTENEFALTRAGSSASGRAKSDFLPVELVEHMAIAIMRIFHFIKAAIPGVVLLLALAFIGTCPVSAQGFFTEGNSLSDRIFNTDNDPTNAQFVVDFPITQPGTLQSILTWGQNSGLGIPGVGESFYAYVLRPVSGGFNVMFETGSLTVVSVGTNTFAAAPFSLQVGDLIAHYGHGIPLSNYTGGPSSVYDNMGLPLPAPSVGDVIELPGPVYPLYDDGGRDYAIAIGVSGVPNLAIAQSGNSVIVSWPANGTNTLLQTTNLASGIWTTNATFTSTTGINSITVASPVGNLFFRLRNP